MLCLGGFFPVFLFGFGGELCPRKECIDPNLCRVVCSNQTPRPPDPPDPPVRPTPTPTPTAAPIQRPSGDSSCQANPLSGSIKTDEDKCASGWGAYVSPVILNDGSARFICTCNSYQPPTGGGYCILKVGADGKLTNILEINGCYTGFTPRIGIYDGGPYCKCVK